MMLRELPAPRLRAYPREATIAEKFKAMVKLDTRNSRMKDFHDVWALAAAFRIDGPPLRSAVAACFERRGTPWTGGMPRVLTPDFYRMPEIATRWQSYLAGSAVLAVPPSRFEDIGDGIVAFLAPVWTSIVAGEAFESFWAPGGPWMSAGDERPG